MWAGRRTGKGKGQRDRVGKTSIRTESFQARVTDLDPIRVSPYGPAAWHLPHREAGHTTAPDRMHRADKKVLASTGASTHVRRSRGTVRLTREITARGRGVSGQRGRSPPSSARTGTASPDGCNRSARPWNRPARGRGTSAIGPFFETTVDSCLPPARTSTA